MNVINRSRKQGMSLLPVLALSAVLAGLLLVATTWKTGASSEDLTQRKLAATSAVNMAAAELRASGTITDKQVTLDGVAVNIRHTVGADGNSMKISADGGHGEVVQATAFRDVAPASLSNTASGSYSGGGSTAATAYGDVGTPQYASNVAYAGAATQTGSIDPNVRSKTGYYSGGGQTLGPATPFTGGWVVYNADNVVISRDSANHEAMVAAENARIEAARQAAAAAEAARVEAINAENARVAAAQAAAQAQADAYAAQAAEASRYAYKGYAGGASATAFGDSFGGLIVGQAMNPFTPPAAPSGDLAALLAQFEGIARNKAAYAAGYSASASMGMMGPADAPRW